MSDGGIFVFMGIDPGRIRPLSACTISGDALPKDWKDESRITALDESMDNNDWITNEEYRTHTGSIEAEQKEKRRRVGEYKNAIDSYVGTKQKSALLEDTFTYYNARLESWSRMRCELLNVKRSHNKFKSFSRSQKSIAFFAKKITFRLRKTCKETGKEGLILMGDGTFRPGGAGHAAVPKKAFIRQFATMYSF